MNEAWRNAFSRVPELLAAHVQLSFSALLLAMAICLPLAIWAVRAPKVAAVILGFASLIQTIPALALLALFYPVLLGLSILVGGGITALRFLCRHYWLSRSTRLLPILRNAVTGLTGVDPAAKEAADGLGMTAAQKLRLVEAPLAAPTIMAGIRTAAVWTIGAATLSTTVGQASLGDMIFAGLTDAELDAGAGGLSRFRCACHHCRFPARYHRKIHRSAQESAQAWIAAAILGAGLIFGTVAILPIPRQCDRDRRKRVLRAIYPRASDRLPAGGAGLYAIEYRDGLGSAVVFRAVMEGDIDISIDYSGTIWTNQMKRTDPVPAEQMLSQISDWVELGVRRNHVRRAGI